MVVIGIGTIRATEIHLICWDSSLNVGIVLLRWRICLSILIFLELFIWFFSNCYISTLEHLLGFLDIHMDYLSFIMCLNLLLRYFLAYFSFNILHWILHLFILIFFIQIIIIILLIFKHHWLMNWVHLKLLRLIIYRASLVLAMRLVICFHWKVTMLLAISEIIVFLYWLRWEYTPIMRLATSLDHFILEDIVWSTNCRCIRFLLINIISRRTNLL